MPMQLSDIIGSMKNVGDRASDDPDGDYRDFITNFLHAQNHFQADAGDATLMLNELPPEKRKSLAEYNGGPPAQNYNMEPHHREAQSLINSILREYK